MSLTDGVARVRIAAAQLKALRDTGVLIEDPRRQRPRYFDGRLLTARDLIRDQQYFLTREADLGQAAGSGVAQGMIVEQGADAHTLTITDGHGVTPSGELVLLPRRIGVPLANVAVTEQLSARFGLARIPTPPQRSRTGLFVLALRPVEFSANPIGAYPNSITGQRTVEDGDIIEASAVILVPWPDDGADDALQARRARAAHGIFIQGSARGLPANVLPLAMVALQNNTVVWIDAAMVRRELGADRADLPGLGYSPRSLRLAHLMQHQDHLGDLLRINGNRPFPAASQFSSLPSAGPLPPGVINPADFTQTYFPAEVDCDFSVIPEDELPALIEDALALPAIDFTLDAEALESTAVAILAPIARSEWRSVMTRLSTRVRALRPAAPNLVAQRKPLEMLMRLRPRAPVVPLPDPADPADAEWQRLARSTNLWFVRRRNLAYRDDLAGTALRFAGAEPGDVVGRVRERLTPLGLARDLDRVLERSTPSAAVEVTALLDSPRFVDSPALTAAALGELSARTPRTGSLDRAAAITAAANLAEPSAGSGLTRLEAAAGGAALPPATLERLAAGSEWREADTRLRAAPDTELPTVATRVLGAEITTRPIRGAPAVAGPRTTTAPVTRGTLAPAAPRRPAKRPRKPK